ncbi:hypothetical protein [Hungatella hathewayi]|nr:hypothetical protein [Hungatella hathewayi]MCD7996551.1 hypothetical protein [Clostridiales bacterium]
MKLETDLKTIKEELKAAYKQQIKSEKATEAKAQKKPLLLQKSAKK